MEALGQRSDSASWKALNAFTAALENQDAEALRALFSPNTRRSTDLDTPIAELLALTKGRRIRAEWDGLCGSGMSTHDGLCIENAFFHFDLYVDDTPYYVHFDLTYRDNRDADALGLTFLVLKSDYITCDESYVPPEGDGIVRDLHNKKSLPQHTPLTTCATSSCAISPNFKPECMA